MTSGAIGLSRVRLNRLNRMSLPDLIEIMPVTSPVKACITVPGSKSITNRALVLAALGQGQTVLEGALWSEDTEVMVNCLRDLGFQVEVGIDLAEAANRTITVQGQSGKVPAGGTLAQPKDLYVGNAGTAARFLSALVCLGSGVYCLSGVPRMHQRPQASLFAALRQLGYRVDSPNGKLPALIHGGGVRPGHCTVSLTESSQFATALLLCANIGGWQVDIIGENADESPYVEMTRQLCRVFPRQGRFPIEPDASGGSYFQAVNTLLQPAFPGTDVSVAGWPDSGWQIDADFPKHLPLPETLSRARQLGDSIMTAIVLGPLAGHLVRFTDLGRLRVQECERVVALRTELSRCGAQVFEVGDTLEIHPGKLHGAEIETYADHRMAMCFAILGLHVPGIKIINPACVKKTFPNFFQKLAAQPPQGLGVEIRNGHNGHRLDHAALHAD